MKKEDERNKFSFIRFIPLVLMVGLFLFFVMNFGSISIEDIQNFTPSNYFLAAGIIILIYAIKSVSMFVSLSIIYISVSIIFPWYLAIIINLVGLAVCMSIPYFIGRFSATPFIEKIISKYPKAAKITEIEEENKWFFVFIIKILGFIPNEIGSLLLGTLKIKYRVYVTAAVLGKTPSMIATTLLGANITKPGTPEFKWSIIISVLVFIGIAIVYWKNKDRFKV